VVTDAQLVREFAASGAEEAFAELVRRHAGLVRAAALRQTNDAHLADEVTQAVFLLLARKAGSLSPKVVLLGWLMQAARFAANDLLRAERRRRQRENAAFQMNTIAPDTNDESARLWERVAPVLDDSLARLREADRSALLLRFFRNCSLAEVGTALGIAEEAARKRVGRALEKLREELQRRGVVASATDCWRNRRWANPPPIGLRPRYWPQ
jgi:RNA polymerase sigma factor (sigma-70 family)